MGYTGWQVEEHECPKHGLDIHMGYVLDENGVKVETFDGDTRKPEDLGTVIWECVSCQCDKWRPEIDRIKNSFK